MKKSFILLLILFFAATGGMVTVNTLLLEEKDAVEITETVLYGDKSIVEGVTIERNVKYADNIHWDTTYVVGEQPKCETAYTFSAEGDLEDGTRQYAGVEFYTGNTRNFDEIENQEELMGLEIAYRELLAETEPGETKSKVVSLADYQEYYTFDIDLDLAGDFRYFQLSEREIRNSLKIESLNAKYRESLEQQLTIVEAFHEAFKIPVIKNHIYVISLEKDLEGRLYSWGYSSVRGGGSTNGLDVVHDIPENADDFHFTMVSAMTEDTCYFTFNTRTSEGDIVDTSEMPQGYGIYMFHYDSAKEQIDVERLKRVYALEPSEYVVWLHLDEQKENLLLFSEEGNECILTVIDLATMQEKQRLVFANENEANYPFIYEDFMVVRYTWDRFAVLSRNADGTYQVEFSADIEEEDAEKFPNMYLYGNVVFDWNGEILLMGDSLVTDEDYYYNENCGFYLAAFDETGLLYYGEYENSLNTGIEYDDYYFNCIPRAEEPLIISW